MQNSINCSVQTCRHNGKSSNCTLNSVTVGACASVHPEAKRETQCGSFECSASM